MGTWSGPSLLTKNGINLQDSEVKMTFHEKKFSFEDSKNQVANGYFQIINKKFIQLYAEKSTSQIFPQGSNVIMELKSSQNTLEIITGLYRLILIKISSQIINEKINTSDANQFYNTTCTLNIEGSTWSIEFKKGIDFILNINSQSNFATGELKTIPGTNKFLLKIQRTSISDLHRKKIQITKIPESKSKIKIEVFDKSILKYSGSCFIIHNSTR